MPYPTSVHQSSILTNLSIKYSNAAMIWTGCMPIVKMSKRADQFYVYTKADSFRLIDDSLGPNAMPNESTWSVSTDNYSVVDHGQADWLAQETIDIADNPLTPEIDTNEFINLLLDIAQEKRVADIIFAAASYPSGNKVTLSGNDQWSGSTDSPVDNVLTAVETCFQRANTLVFGQAAWKVFRALPEVIDAVKGATRQQATPGGLATPQEVISLFEVDHLLVGRAKYNSAEQGQTASYTNLWGKHMAALHVKPNPGIKTITFGTTIAEALKRTTKTFDGKRGVKGSHHIKVTWNSTEKVVASDLGYLITDAVA